MGCDGGTIPKRDELVKKKQKPEEKDKQAESIAKWRYCALSCQVLRKPIVSCPVGRLYNKEAIIQFLLDKETVHEVVSHIRGLKDVKELNLTLKAGYEEKAVEGGINPDVGDSPYICPVTGLEMNGKYKFCYIQSCGCVLSERAFKEVKSENCLKCTKPYQESDVIIINGTDEEIEMQKSRMMERRATDKNNKSKGKKRKIEEDVDCSDNSKSVAKNDKNIASESKSKKSTKVSDQKLTKTTKIAVNNLIPEKATCGYSVANDEKASETFKSLFTSHESAKNKPTAHWITFNPLYN